MNACGSGAGPSADCLHPICTVPALQKLGAAVVSMEWLLDAWVPENGIRWRFVSIP